MKASNIAVALVVLATVFLLIIPLPAFAMDMLLIINIAIALMVLLFSLYIKDPLEFSVFPTLLLFITLFRLALNLSSTRLILGNGGDAGNVIKTFGGVVIGDNYVVGIIVFLIIMVIQFMVVTKGAERVAEVAARFTLDAMPGKQMAIDADLNSGIIDEAMAKERRLAIQREADFNGAMDGASKFIKGDAIAGIIVTLINIVGGIIIGMTTLGQSFGEVAQIYTRATIGDGLVSQIPALLISISSGVIVTRSGTEMAFGEEVSGQIFAQPNVMIVAGALLAAVSMVPGLPVIPMWLLAGILVFVGISTRRKRLASVVAEKEDEAELLAKEKRKPENVTELLRIEPIVLYFGYGLIPMADATQGGDLPERMVMLRRMFAIDLGLIVPVIRLRDNVQFGANTYSIEIKGDEVARAEVMADHLLAISTGEVEEEIPGIPTTEPTFGTPALWIAKSERGNAELFGYSVVDPPSVIATHMTEIIKQHGHELLNRQQVQTLLDNLRKTQPVLVDEVVPKLFSLGEVQKVLAGLLEENVPIRDMASIVETLGDYGNLTRDTDTLIEYVRQALRRTISKRFLPDAEAHAITLDPTLEQMIVDSTKQSERGAYLAMEPSNIRVVFDRLRTLVENVQNHGQTPVILTSPLVRRQFRKIAEQISPELAVLSFNELEQNIEVYSEGVVKL
ncbi:MAG: flagellar biosynthesis protein FlhA [Oscillospiraceae bacterium]|nr:flagellar biosynthesis protein FlhA [Oscillospiraceae bacterium]